MTTQEARALLNLTIDFLPVGSSNRPSTPLRPAQITIHNTDNAAPSADASAHARYLKGPDARQRQVSWHFTVDDQSVYQSLPVWEIGWHSGSGNATSIAVEICENHGIDQPAANDRAAQLVAILAREHGISPSGGILQHHYWSGKDCPKLLRRGSGWDDFLATVATYHRSLEACPGNECTILVESASSEVAASLNASISLASALELFETPPSSAANSAGSSRTTGLRGSVRRADDGSVVTDASETISARREQKDFGSRTARQVRTSRGDYSSVDQFGYSWQDRDLPRVELLTNRSGLGGPPVIAGKATYFGKYDLADEGTGTPALKIVQTNSSVFGVSIPKGKLIELGLAKISGSTWKVLGAGLVALVEVYCPATRRLARLPLVDVGPGSSSDAKADLTVAAAAWLLDDFEEKAKGYRLANLKVEIRIV